jgi:hypothetical protein
MKGEELNDLVFSPSPMVKDAAILRRQMKEDVNSFTGI